MKTALNFTIFFLLFLLSFSFKTAGQYTIQGRMKDQKNEAVPFANAVLLHLPDSAIVATALTDTAGYFNISAPSVEHTLLKAVASGYHTQTKLITGTANDITIDFVLHAADRLLSGVTVTANKPVIERKADRTVFNVESSVSSVGADALELLKRSPGVRVNNDNISVVGKSTVSIMINDRLVQLSADELAGLLRSMPAETISKIEVITAPPARYDAQGNAGIINIVTRKQQKNGLNGSLTTAYEQHTAGGVQTNGNINYRFQKFNFFGNGNFFTINRYPTRTFTTFYPTEKWVQTDDQKDKNLFGRFQVGADYNINKKSVVGVVYAHGWGSPVHHSQEDIYTKAYSLATGLLDSVTRTLAETHDNGRRDVGNINYEWRIDTNGRKLNIDLDYFTRTGRKRRDFVSNNSLPDGSLTADSSNNQTFGRQVNNIGSVKVDLEWPTHFAKYSFGGKASFVHNVSDNVFNYLDGNDFVMDPNKTNSFDYTEYTQALYASAHKELKKWELQLGLRAENTQSKGYSPTLNQTTTNNYFKLFPSVFVQYNLSEDHKFNVNYTRRINRPDFWDMNPFRVYTTPNAYEQGNPFLQPSFSNNFEIGYTLKSKYTFAVFSESVQNYFTRVSMVDTVNSTFIFTRVNAGNNFSAGLRANAVVNFTKWWECNLQASGFYMQFTPKVYGVSGTYSQPSFYIETDNTISFNKDKTLLAEANFYYLSKQQADVDLQSPVYSLGLGFKALLFHKQLTIGVSGYDVLRTEWSVFTNDYNHTVQNLYFDDRSVRVALTWKFGNANIKLRERNTGADEAKRAN